MAGFSNTSLERLMAVGIAYHHAGLTLEERAHVEVGYRAGTIKVMSYASKVMTAPTPCCDYWIWGIQSGQ